jgi:serine/threonine-protein kinase
VEQEIRFCTTADGVRIAYATAGAGPPFVKAANWLNHLEYDWQSPIWRPLLEEFARDHLLVRYDERGNGLSDWDVTDLSFEAFVRDLETVVDTLALDRFPILGISQGGPVAIAYAVRHPEKVSHLILYGSFPLGFARRQHSPEEIELRQAQKTLIKFGWGRDNPAFRQLWSTLYVPEGTTEHWQWFNDLQRMSASPENALRLLNEISQIDVVDLLPQLRVPTLVVHRRGDAAVPAEQGRMLAASIPGARFLELEGKNHLLLEHEPEWPRFVSEVRQFLGLTNPPPLGRSSASLASASAARKGLTAGDRLGRYTIKSLLGQGGMGEVYLAEDTQLFRKVALKVLPAEVAANQDRMRRFKQEATTAAALNHPNIAHIYEIGESDGRNFLAMEFIDGSTLRQIIHETPAGLPKLLRYLQHAAEALAKAHTAGIIHRDLKPDNIMITRDGHAKVVDFGLAKLIEPQKFSATSSEMATAILPQSQPGTVLGTVGYMSPEQAQGLTGEIDHRSDIFSFGCILYEAITRRKAFPGKDAIDSLNKIIREQPAPLSDAGHDVPYDLQRIVRRCLAKDPDDRFQSIKEVAIELKDVRHQLQTGSGDTTSSRAEPQIESIESAFGSTAATVVGAAVPTKTAGSGATRSWPPTQSSLTSIKRNTVLISLLILVIIVGVLIFYLRPGNNGAAIDSIAVLPFVNETHDPDSEYLADGVTEGIINSLAQLPSLRVIDRSSVFRYKDKQVDPISVGKELNVRAILAGRVLQRGDTLLISTELIDLRDNKQIWGEQYNRRLADLVAVQRDITNEISSNLRLKIGGAEANRLASRSSENPEAYQLYLKGRFFINKRTEQDLRKAIDYFQQAIAKDPNNALVYTGLSYAHAALVFPLGAVSPGEEMPKARAAALQALAIDNSLGEAHASLAYEAFFYEWDWQLAEREFKRAIELNPNDADAHHGYAHLLMALGRADEAMAETKRALEISPLDLVLNIHLGWHYLYVRQYTSALDQLNKVVEMDTNLAQTYTWLGLTYEQMGNYPAAISAFQRAINLFPGGSTQAEALLGHAYAVSGRKAEAVRTISDLTNQAKQKYVAPYQIAAIYAGLGDKDQAFAWLEKAYQERSDWMVSLPGDQRFDSLRTDPRYAGLLQRLGLKS